MRKGREAYEQTAPGPANRCWPSSGGSRPRRRAAAAEIAAVMGGADPSNGDDGFGSYTPAVEQVQKVFQDALERALQGQLTVDPHGAALEA